MPYQLGQYVQAHNRNHRRRGVENLAALGVAGARMAYNNLPSFPSRSEQKLVNTVIKRTHEPRNIDTVVTGATASTTAYTPYLLNATTQSTSGAAARVGRRFKMESLRLAYRMLLDSTKDQDSVRLIVFIDTECRGSAAGTSDLLSNNTFGDAQINSSYNFDNIQRRFRVLHDEVVNLQATVYNAGYGRAPRHKVVSLPLNTVVHCYNTSAGTIADIDSGSLYLFVMGDTNSGPTAYGFDARVVYRDL